MPAVAASQMFPLLFSPSGPGVFEFKVGGRFGTRTNLKLPLRPYNPVIKVLIADDPRATFSFILSSLFKF